MVKANNPFTSFNAGETGSEVQGRINLENYGATASYLRNIMPEAAGPMSLRPGTEFFSELAGEFYLRRFVFAVDQKYLMLFLDNQLRIAQDGGVIFRDAVTSVVAESTFSASNAQLMTTGGAPGTLTLSAVTSGTAANLIDNNAATTVVFSAAATATITSDLGSAKTVRRLRIGATLTQTKAPKNFTLTGSATGAFAGEQVTLYSTTTETSWLDQEIRKFTLTTTGSYRYYRLTITVASDGTTGAYQLSAFGLYDSQWLDISESKAPDVAVVTGSNLSLTSDGNLLCGVRQSVVTSNSNAEHALNLVVARGPVSLKIGSGPGLQDYRKTTALRTGSHSLVFTPLASPYWIELTSTEERSVIVTSCQISGLSDLILSTPWLAADFQTLRFEQSKDVLYVADGVNVKKRIERRDAQSWSLCDSDEKDGPFKTVNIDKSISITNTDYTSNQTLTANRAIFTADQAGSLIRVFQQGQVSNRTLTGFGQTTDAVRITGVGATRIFTVNIAGSWSGTLTLERSFDGPDSGFGVTGFAVVAGSNSIDDSATLNNVEAWYRVSYTTATLGAPLVTVTASAGGGYGVARVTDFISSTQVSVETLSRFYKIGPSTQWQFGAWSAEDGHPKGIALFDGRLWNGYGDEFWGSASGLYESQAIGEKAGDAINKTIATGNVSKIQSMLALSRLVILTEGSEVVLRSSAFDDPITPTNLTVRDLSSWGSADIAPVKVDSRGLFVDRSGIHLMELVYASDIQDYTARPLTRLHKDLGRPGLRQVAVARRPETRMFIVKSDGTGLVKLYDPGENVLGWSRIESDGQILSVEVLPGDFGTGEDEVWFAVARTLPDGITRYYLEKLGMIYLASLADANCVDSFVRVDQGLVNAVNFNGTTNYLTRGAGLTGAADGKSGTVSFWVKLAGSDTVEQTLIRTDSNDYLCVKRTTAGKWQIIGKNAAGATILTLTSGGSYGVASGWHHVVASWDLATGSGRLYINNASDLAAGSILTNDTIDYTRTDLAIGARTDGTLKLTGDIAELYVNTAATVDVSVLANLRKFISASRVPVDLNTSGSWPTATAPILYLSGPRASIATNRGTGGNFVKQGVFWDASTEPASNLASQSSVFTGLNHLEGCQVQAFVDGIDRGKYLVSGGQIDLTNQFSKASIGLGYEGRYRSSSQALNANAGTPLGQRTKNEHLILKITRSTRGFFYGPYFPEDENYTDQVPLDDMASRELSLRTAYENGLETGFTEQVTIPGGRNRDPHLCIVMPSPNPVTIAGYVLGQDNAERT